MVTKSQKIWGWIVCLLFFSMIFLLGIYCKNSKRDENKKIESYGITGVCTVTRVSASNRFNDGGKRLIIRYEYEVNGKTYVYNSFYRNWDYLYNAFIGMKYEIKYLEDNPQKSILYIDKPIVSEYKNIVKERERMRASGKYQKELKDTVSIESIKARYPEYFR